MCWISRASRICAPAWKSAIRRRCSTAISIRFSSRVSSRACEARMSAMNPPNDDENKLIAERRAKLQQLRQQGTAYPNDFRRDVLAGQLHTAYDQKSAEWLEQNPHAVSVGGRMMRRNNMGRSSFVGLQDRTGTIQLFLQQDTLKDTYEAFKRWDIGDIVGAQGTLFKTKTGELSV